MGFGIGQQRLNSTLAGKVGIPKPVSWYYHGIFQNME